jgi:hypothetical protein
MTKLNIPAGFNLFVTDNNGLWEYAHNCSVMIKKDGKEASGGLIARTEHSVIVFATLQSWAGYHLGDGRWTFQVRDNPVRGERFIVIDDGAGDPTVFSADEASFFLAPDYKEMEDPTHFMQNVMPVLLGRDNVQAFCEIMGWKYNAADTSIEVATIG